MTTAKSVKLTATAENGEVFTRKTARTYLYAVYIETTYSDGEVSNSKPSWASRPDLAAKSLDQFHEHATSTQGKEVLLWDMQKGDWVHTGRFRTKVRAVCVPVNA